MYLGTQALTVDGLASNPSTTISGVISDGGYGGGTGASLIKAGTGTLTLTGANTYSGGTTINAGAVNVGFSGGTATTASLGTGNVAIGAGAVLDYYAASSAGARITNNGNLAFYNASSAGHSSITNNSNSDLYFYNTSTAGSSSITNNYILTFEDTSTAGSSTITNNSGGYLEFNIASTAGNSSINTTNGGYLVFNDNASAGSSTMTNNGGGIYFDNASSGGSSTITNNNNSYLYFFGTSTASNATVVNNAGGTLDLSYLTAGTGLSIGSLSGSGAVFLGSQALTVDGLASNPSTTISGVIADGGNNGGTGGSLIKTGTGTLTLTGANTYTGGTTVTAGKIVAGGAALGTGAATVASGATLSVGESLNTSLTALTTHTLSISSLAVTLGSTTPLLTFNLGAGGTNGVSDVLHLTGSGNELTFSSSGMFDINFASATGASLGAGTYEIFTLANSELLTTAPLITSYTAGTTGGNLADIKGGAFAYVLNGGGSITGLQYSITGADTMPEPASLLLLAPGGALGLLAARRRRVRSAH